MENENQSKLEKAQKLLPAIKIINSDVADSRPRPDAPPVMRTVFPFSSIFFIF